jgi:phage gpG-like protein
MPQFLRFSVVGEEQYARGFDVTAREASNLREPLGEIRDTLERSVEEQFNSEGAHGLGARWRPLNEDYEKWKQQRYPDTGMLVRTGQAKNLLMSPAATIDLTDSRLVWGIPDGAVNRETGEPIRDYMEAHQAGRGVPQRKFIAITQAERREWDRILVNWFNGIRHRAFG